MIFFALFKYGATDPIWAAVTTQEHADRVAITAAINGGMVELLSGRHLADRLAEVYA